MEKPPTQEKVYTVNEAQPEDAAGIARVRKETWLATYPNEEAGVTVEDVLSTSMESEEQIMKWRAIIENKMSSRKLWVAKENLEVIGYSQGKKSEQENECLGLYVLPSHHGKGVGRELMQKVVDWAGDEKPLVLSMAVYSDKAKELYQKFGFKSVGETEKGVLFASGASIPTIKMIKPAKKN